MAELNDILASGSVTQYKRGLHTLIDTDNLTAALINEYEDGLNIPHLANAAAASNGTIFWDLSTGMLRYKTIGGIVLQFNMSLV